MIIDGKAIAAQVKASLQGSDAKLAVIMVGDDPASSVYVRNKERACAEVGIQSCSRRLPSYGVDRRSHCVYCRAQCMGGRYPRTASSSGTH